MLTPTPILHRSHRRISPVGDPRAVETVCRVYVVTLVCGVCARVRVDRRPWCVVRGPGAALPLKCGTRLCAYQTRGVRHALNKRVTSGYPPK